MDIVIKNIESLRNGIDGHTQTPQRVVVDFSKTGTDEFAQLFFSACEKYKEPKIRDIEECKTCKHWTKNLGEEPCHSCYLLDQDHYEPAEPTLKEVTARMQSEFDATGKDVAYFMNHRVKPGGINND